jgi:ATP-dependent DNA helicase RecG
MNAEDLRALLDKNEDEHIEFKKAESSFDFDKLVEYSVALANERGGKIVLGVTDRKPRRITGTQAYKDDLARIKEHLVAQVGLRIDVEEVSCPEGRVLVFQVPSRPIGRPLHVNGRYLMRAGQALTAMSADMLKRIFDEDGSDFTAQPCEQASFDDLDKEAIEEFRSRWAKKTGIESIMRLSREQLLSDAELVTNGTVSFAALILFGTHAALGRHLGQAEVIFEYRANDSTGPAQQRLEFRQGFFSFYDKLWETIDLRNTNQHYQDGLFIWDIKTFNERAIREAILNAVSHRDYRSGASVFVRQYPERIEITNPGGLPSGITLDNILWEQFPRNRRLAETFARCGLVERAGQGMNRIYESCIRESKDEPDFTHTDTDHFWITLRGAIRHPEFLRVLEKIGNELLVSFSTDDFVVIQAVFERRALSVRLAPIAERLHEEGVLEKVPSTKGHMWVLARKLYAAIGKKGEHTKRTGLDRDTHKALILKHIQTNEAEGSRLEEFRQILPFMDRGNVQVLLREMRDDGLIHHHGKTRAGRWYPGIHSADCRYSDTGKAPDD